MIKINRREPPENNFMDSKKTRVLNKIEDAVNNNELNSKTFENLWRNEEIKKFLHKSQHHKCCYCERKRDQRRESDVEHFRPKSEVKEQPQHQGYWWLSYEWENLLIACKTCNQTSKKTHFPLEDESKRAYNKKDNLHKEQPLLINPLEEDPSQFIEYDLPGKNEIPIMIKAIGKCNRGTETIKLTGINSQEVMEERASKFRDYKHIYECIKKDPNNILQIKELAKNRAKDLAEESEIFSGFATFYFKKMGVLK